LVAERPKEKSPTEIIDSSTRRSTAAALADPEFQGGLAPLMAPRLAARPPI